MIRHRAQRNQTLTLSDAERHELSAQLMFLKESVLAEDILDKVLCQDILKALPQMPESCADLLIIDPPYNHSISFGWSKFKQQQNSSYEEYLRSWLPQAVKLLKPNASIYVCADWKSSASVQRVLEECGITLMNRITWQREKGRGAARNWKNAMEDIWFGVRNPKDYYFDLEAVKLRRHVKAPYKKDGQPKDWQQNENGEKVRATCPPNYWNDCDPTNAMDDLVVPFWSMPENTDHPTQKPEKLIAKLILASCPKGGLVIDPFLGSGTTAVVAKKLGRHYCGIELNPEYACWALKRLDKAATDTRIQGYEDGVFWERNEGKESKKKK